MNEKGMLLNNLSAVAFSMVDLHLFLNTHPENASAIALFSQYRQKYMALVAEYERMYGPLSAVNGVQDNRWAWIRSPWPWEYGANTEVR
ncbi:MAG TPA: spore coat protein CotJB [Clostridia bacterium]|nr:spore coat protein CotJB [Clostridia bacterium]